MRQSVCLLVMFLFGSSAIMGLATAMAQDAWIALLLAMAASVPFLLMLGRLRSLFPKKGFFDLATYLLGRAGGKTVALLMSWYALHLCSLVLRNFSEFVEVCVMPETPQLPIMLLMMMVVVYLAKSGVDTMGKWSSCTMPVLFFMILATILLSANRMDFSRILPIMSHDIGALAKGAYPLVSFPFMETIVFACATNGAAEQRGPYKTYLFALSFGSLALLLISLRNIFLLGPAVLGASVFPSYTAAKIIHLGDIIARLEGSISMNFILAGIAKLSVCLLAMARGVAHLFGLRDYKCVLTPLGLLVIALSAVLYQSSMEMYAFIEVYHVYAFPFQLVIPPLIWILAEHRAKRERQQAEAPNATAGTEN